MVGGYGVDTPSGEQFAQECYAVRRFLDGGIALDARSEAQEVVSVKEEILRTCLGRHFHAFCLGFADELKLVGGRDVADVEACTALACEVYGASGGFDTCFAGTDVRVTLHRDGAAAFVEEAFARSTDDGLILGMDRNDKCFH